MKFKITKQQILQLHHNTKHENDQLVIADLKRWFPDAFKKELENGKTYKHKSGWIAYKICDKFGFGFEDGEFFNVTINFTHTEDYEEYPIESFKKLLIAEAEKRGFKSGVWVDRSDYSGFLDDSRIIKLPEGEFNFKIYSDEFFIRIGDRSIFKNGIWAKIIE